MAKRALCIGINNYPGTHMDLKGCVNDANAWEAELKSREFTVKKLLDEQATKAAMVAAFKEVIGGAASGDLVVITFSGHGTFVPDQSGDEKDGLDEGLCPHDIQTGGGALLDDEIHALFAARKSGVRLVLISDSCHSGTVTRAAQQDDADAEAPRPRFLPMGNWMSPEQTARALAAPGAAQAVRAPKGTSPLAKALSKSAGDLLLSGCEEGADHFSFDAHIAGKPVGAFTHFALKALRSLPASASYEQWHAAITPGSLPSTTYPQTPQIVGDAKARKARILA